MIYLIIALVVAVVAAGLLGWRLYRATRALGMAEARCRSLQKERAQRENLQVILDSRSAENRRLRSRLRKLEADMDGMEQQASKLNIDLFHESGLRIYLEKEDAARRMKLDLMEKQLDEANRKLRQERAQAKEAADRLNAIIEEQRESIERLSQPQPRRAARRREGLPNQVTLDDIMKP